MKAEFEKPFHTIYTQQTMPPIRFTAAPFTIGSWTVLKLPKDASKKFPSRGMAMAHGTINGQMFDLPLEPDGQGSHWFKIDKAMKVKAGDTATIEMEPAEKWPEPDVPADIKKALAAAAPKVREVWNTTTTMARWDWIRWIRSTNNPDTRAKRIVVACSKMKAGEKRPCCFNRSMCTEPEVSKGGVLLEPASS